MVLNKILSICPLKLIILYVFICGNQQIAVAQIKYLSLKDYSIEKITLTGFSQYRIYAHLQIQNDTMTFVMRDISGKIYKNDKLIARGNISDMYLDKGQNNIDIRGDFTVPPFMTIHALFNVLIKRDFSLYTIDTDMILCFSSGEIKTLQKRKIPINGIIK